MKKKAKKLAKLARRREVVNLALAHAGLAVLAVTDDGGIEKKLRAIWTWADGLLSQQDPQEISAIGGLQRLQTKMSEALDVLASLVGAELEAFPEPARSGGDSQDAKASRADAAAREVLKDPAARRAYLAARDPTRARTSTLTDEQKRWAAKMGIIDPKQLAKIAEQMRAGSPIIEGHDKALQELPLPARRQAAALTPEQLKMAARLGITDEKRLAALADQVAGGSGRDNERYHRALRELAAAADARDDVDEDLAEDLVKDGEVNDAEVKEKLKTLTTWQLTAGRSMGLSAKAMAAIADKLKSRAAAA